jgi:SulP family sulfate permease
LALDPARLPARWPIPRAEWALLRGDAIGGFVTAVVMLAVAGSYGIVALAPLGPGHAQWGFLMGVYTAVVASVVPLLFGARGPLLGGPSAALTLLIPPLLVALAADARLRLPDGTPNATALLAVVAVGVMLSGAMQLLVGALRLGMIVRYVPYPVHVGFMNGVAILMVLAMLPMAGGLPSGTSVAALPHGQPGALMVAAVSLYVAVRPPAWTQAVPGYLSALLAGTAVHHLLGQAGGGAWLGPLFGALHVQWPSGDALAPLARPGAMATLMDHIDLVLRFAIALTFISSMQTMLASSVVDGLTHRRRDGERILRGQGAANVVAGLLGVLPGAAGVSTTAVNLRTGGKGTLSVLVFGVSVVLVLAFGGRLMRHVPMAAIAGVFIAVAFSLVDTWSRRASVTMLRCAVARRRPPQSLVLPYAVMALVALTAVFVSLTHGVAVGVVAAMLMFIRSNVRPSVRFVANGTSRSSRKVRPQRIAELLKANGARIAVVELDGALFFGTADAAAREIERIALGSEQVIIDFRRVSDVDASGARVLLQAAAMLHATGKRLLFASLHAGDPRLRTIQEMDLERLLIEADFSADVDTALERAEERLLETLAPPTDDAVTLTLGQTMLGNGLDEEELSHLAARLTLRRVARGQPVFRYGEPGDAMYVAVSGQIGIRLPSPLGPDHPAHRLVAFAPGVVFGEMGLLQNSTRSADAIAEEDTLVLELPRDHFKQLASERPQLHGKLMLSLSLHLSSRLSSVTDELRSVLNSTDRPAGRREAAPSAPNSP